MAASWILKRDGRRNGLVHLTRVWLLMGSLKALSIYIELTLTLFDQLRICFLPK